MPEGETVPDRLGRRPTQRQIAAEVGVSVTTVSRILNPEETNPERWASARTIELIQAAAASLGYRPNALAVSLRTARSNTIGLILPTTGDPVISAIQAGIDQVAAENRMIPLVTCTLDQPGLRAQRTTTMLDHLVAGLIFADAALDESFLAEVGAPFTLVHRRHPAYVSVGADDVAAGRLAAEHLIGLGRTRLAFIGGTSTQSTGRDRIEGFRTAIAAAGLPEPVIIETDHYVESGQHATRQLMSRTPRPDGIFAAHDWAAIGSLGVLRDYGLRVAEDVAVVGCYDTPLARATDLTSLAVDLGEMGRRACRLLLAQLAGEPVESETLPVTLVARGTTRVSHA